MIQSNNIGEFWTRLTVQIETERLVLREFKRTDWKEVQEYASDPEVSRYMEWGPNTAEQTVQFVDRAIDNQRQKPRRIYDFAVTLKATGKLIGAAGFRVYPLDNEQADIGYCYNKNYWRQGFGAEVCNELIKFGFQHFKFHRMFATCDANNLGSAGVLRKCGMRQEGHFVQDKKIKGQWRDTLLFAILQSEWKELIDHG